MKKLLTVLFLLLITNYLIIPALPRILDSVGTNYSFAQTPTPLPTFGLTCTPTPQPTFQPTCPPTPRPTFGPTCTPTMPVPGSPGVTVLTIASGLMLAFLGVSLFLFSSKACLPKQKYQEEE